MKILHRYILGLFLRNFLAALGILIFLFLVVDFFDRIDNIAAADTSIGATMTYFLLKIPLMMSQMFPIAMLTATMFTIGLLSKNSELTAMRATGVTVFWLGRPLLLFGFGVSLLSIVMNETIVPHATRRVREIYNIDMMQKDKTGSYSQTDFWWRSGDFFYSVGTFDSRSETLLDLSKFEVNAEFQIVKRFDAQQVTWIDPFLGWNMQDIIERRFLNPEKGAQERTLKALPLPIPQKPEDFYDKETDPHTMSFLRLRKFIKEQSRNGVRVAGYFADLHDKISFQFISVVISFVVFPFMVRPARSASMASNFFVGLIFGFAYYAVHSFSIAFGRAEILPPLLSAWMANILMLFIGVVLNLGAESPS